MDQEQSSPQETPEPAPQVQETEPSQDPAPSDPESPEPEAAPETETPEGGEEKAADAPPGETPEAKHKRKGGYERRIDRLERQIAEKDAMLAQALARLPQPPQPGAEQPKTTNPGQQAADQLNAIIKQGVQQALAEQARQNTASSLAKKWEEQIPADEEEAYEVRRMVNQTHTLRDGPVKEALLTSEYLPRIMAVLSRNPLELARLNALPEAQAAREIGRLEAQFVSGAAPAKPSPVSRPPAPPSRVGASIASTRSIESLPISEYKRLYRSGKR